MCVAAGAALKKLRITWGNKAAGAAGGKPATSQAGGGGGGGGTGSERVGGGGGGGRRPRGGPSFEYMLHSSDALLVGRVRLTEAGWGIKVGVGWRCCCTASAALHGQLVTGALLRCLPAVLPGWRPG
jgi:hypothetical protein